MPGLLDSIIAAFTATLAGVTGPAGAPSAPANGSVTCTYSSSQSFEATDAETTELLAKIHKVVAELRVTVDDDPAATDLGSKLAVTLRASSDVPASPAAQGTARGGSPPTVEWNGSSVSISSGERSTDRHCTSVSTEGERQAGLEAAAAATELAAKIVNGVGAVNVTIAPASADSGEDDGGGGDDSGGDESGDDGGGGDDSGGDDSGGDDSGNDDSGGDDSGGDSGDDGSGGDDSGGDDAGDDSAGDDVGADTASSPPTAQLPQAAPAAPVPGYAAPEYAQPGYAQPGYAQTAPLPGAAAPGYVGAAAPTPGYAAPTAPTPGYVGAAAPTPGYAAPTAPLPGAAVPGYSAPGYAPDPSAPGYEASGTSASAPAAALEQLIRDLATRLKTSTDPAMVKLGGDLDGVLSDASSGVPGSPVGTAQPDAAAGRPAAVATHPKATALSGPIGQVASVLPSGLRPLFADDFEGGDLSKWGSCQSAGVNGECTGVDVDTSGMGVQRDPERGMVAQFKVEDGKVAEIGGERSEVRDDDPEVVTKEGDDRWYTWSMKFPADFPEPDGGYYIVMQWHQNSDSGSPPLAIDITNGTVDIGGDGVGAPRQTIGPIRRGEWVDYTMHVKFSPDDGFVEAWENGKQTVQKVSRPTMTGEENYLKVGIYRDEDATGDAEVSVDNVMIYDGAGGGRATSPGKAARTAPAMVAPAPVSSPPQPVAPSPRPPSPRPPSPRPPSPRPVAPVSSPPPVAPVPPPVPPLSDVGVLH